MGALAWLLSKADSMLQEPPAVSKVEQTGFCAGDKQRGQLQ